MNLNQYKELCGACDEILNSSKSSVITKSIVWLHVDSNLEWTNKAVEFLEGSSVPIMFFDSTKDSELMRSTLEMDFHLASSDNI